MQDDKQDFSQLSKRERRLLKRQLKLQGRGKQEKVGKLKRFAFWGIGLVILVGIIALGYRYFTSLPEIKEEDIISRKGIHWHPELSIYTKDEKQEISANIGIGAAHQPVHTHDTTGTLHLEIKGLVLKDDTKLGRFFEIWGKRFDSSCIFEFCNGEEGTVKMFVNGKENTEFSNYLMNDKDSIEIKYE